MSLRRLTYFLNWISTEKIGTYIGQKLGTEFGDSIYLMRQKSLLFAGTIFGDGYRGKDGHIYFQQTIGLSRADNQSYSQFSPF